jgi:hypothetical protein
MIFFKDQLKYQEVYKYSHTLMAEHNWNTLSTFLESIGYTIVLDNTRGFLHFHNQQNNKDITFEKQNRYSRFEVEMILSTNEIRYNTFRVYLSSLENRISP